MRTIYYIHTYNIIQYTYTYMYIIQTYIYIYIIAIGYCSYCRSSSRFSIHKLQFFLNINATLLNLDPGGQGILLGLLQLQQLRFITSESYNPPKKISLQRSQKNMRKNSPTHPNFFWRTSSTFLDRTAMLHEQQLTLALVGDTQLPRWQWILGWSWPPKCIGTLEKRWRAKGHWELD